MPSKFTTRDFEENAYYHVINRGVEKRKIFLDTKDYQIFIYYLFIYLKPLNDVLSKYPQLPIRLHNKNLSSEVDVISYCMMPNHFHLLLRQTTKTGISKLMKQVTNAYTEYFNKKYKRSGSLMQGSFRAVKVNTNEQLVHLSRYIHLNPVIGGVVNKPDDHTWSSYRETIKKNGRNLVKSDLILEFVGSTDGYEKFVKDQISYSKELKKLENITME